MPWLTRMNALAAKVNPVLEILAVGLAMLVLTVALSQSPAPLRPALPADFSSIGTAVTAGD